MATPAPTVGTPYGEEVKPYKIHVSSKYLDLTRQKLELTRLPHENSDPQSKHWWEPKPIVEPLIDFWLERYSWREEEARLNDLVPQFRTSLIVPGIGFSDRLPNNTPVIRATAELFDSLMHRLGYKHYLVSNTGPSSDSPAQTDWKLANCLAEQFQGSCLGAHFVSPPWKAPKLQEAPLAWTKWKVVGLLKRPQLGYSEEDIAALRNEQVSQARRARVAQLGQYAFDGRGFREPNTLSYALCDSPTGLLLFVLMILRVLGADKDFSSQELITLTELTWLPGPESMMRFWAYSAIQSEEEKRPATRPKVAVTVFAGLDEASGAERPAETAVLPLPVNHPYVCPVWGRSNYDVVAKQCVPGTPGLIAWKRPEVLVHGVRRLAEKILAKDTRMQMTEQPGAVLLGQIVSGGYAHAPADISGTTVQGTESPPLSSPKKITSPSDQFLQVPGPDAQRRTSTTQQPLLSSGSVTETISGDEDGQDHDSSPDTVIAVGARDMAGTASQSRTT
ncbi:epoxide hydrolase [Emericellopsis cladophorae]|uniref:Epoxide hydrolase n=1 Tax=Emericellopsis cladophorae TaxID=2686198 RepID=A0A9Q0BF92_9HYPO|nr:epoxide hydrolase [Emericellopsis cladophorae]KAI6782435.1 epoxide hydrolase [Emericellopsis cladophorae]